jgi:hypothetical protein
VLKSEIEKVKALVIRFKAKLRAQHKQNRGKGQARPLPSKIGKQANAGAFASGEMQQKTGRGRPRSVGKIGYHCDQLKMKSRHTGKQC